VVERFLDDLLEEIQLLFSVCAQVDAVLLVSVLEGQHDLVARLGRCIILDVLLYFARRITDDSHRRSVGVQQGNHVATDLLDAGRLTPESRRPCSRPWH
jgi:hypothetical protein